MGEILHEGYGTTPTSTVWWLAINSPHSSTPLDLLHTTGVALAVLGFMLLFARGAAPLLMPLAAVGSMTLTLYTAHVILLTSPLMPGSESESFVMHVALALVFAVGWRRWRGRGPLEALLAAVATRARQRVLSRRNACPVKAPDVRLIPSRRKSEPPVTAQNVLYPVQPEVPKADGEPGTTRDVGAKEVAGAGIALIRRLSALPGDLETTAAAADRVAHVAREVVDTDAVAVLLPDRDTWTVSGGIGLRPLERKLRLVPEHWMLREVLRAGTGLIIDDTETVRSRLRDVPLAYRKYLMAVPLTAANALVVVARDAETFGPKDLGALARAVSTTAQLLKQALDTRDLARGLQHLIQEE
jgi:hypothetical protein